jgi:hypothetical protein
LTRTRFAGGGLLGVIAVVAAHQSVTAKEPAPRTWTSAGGKFTVEATLVDYSDDDVRLRKANGKTVTVPLEKISDEDVQFLSSSRVNVYRVPNRFRVANPIEDMYWLVQLHQVVDGFEVLGIRTNKTLDEAPSAATISAQPLENNVTPLQHEGIAKLFISESMKGWKKSFDVKGTVEEQLYNGKKRFVVRATMTRAEGDTIHLRVLSVFKKRCVYHLQCLALESDVAEKMLAVADTIEELPDEDAP